jgi:hypothetical protein
MVINHGKERNQNQIKLFTHVYIYIYTTIHLFLFDQYVNILKQDSVFSRDYYYY